MWLEHIKLELIDAMTSPARLSDILFALLLLIELDLMPDEVEQELMDFLNNINP